MVCLCKFSWWAVVLLVIIAIWHAVEIPSIWTGAIVVIAAFLFLSEIAHKRLCHARWNELSASVKKGKKS